jgi:hypothetical protein
MRSPDRIDSGNVIDITPVLIQLKKEPLFDETDGLLDDLNGGFIPEEELEEALEAIRINEEAARLIVEL